VIGQDFRADLTEPGAVFLEARQNDPIAVIHVNAAKARPGPAVRSAPTPPRPSEQAE
jgi:hypothetical protein